MIELTSVVATGISAFVAIAVRNLSSFIRGLGNAFYLDAIWRSPLAFGSKLKVFVPFCSPGLQSKAFDLVYPFEWGSA